MQPFYKTVLRASSEYSCTECIEKGNLPEIKDKYFISRF